MTGGGTAVVDAGTEAVPTILTDAGRPLVNLNPVYGFNSQMNTGPTPWNAVNPIDGGTLIAAIRMLHPGVIRYPGGTNANYFNWDAGVPFDGFPDEGTVAASNVVDLTQLKTAWSQIGEPDIVFVVNMLTGGPNTNARHDNLGNSITASSLCANATGTAPNYTSACLESQVTWLKTAQNTYGLPIKYVELGNEFYLLHSTNNDNDSRFADATAYAVEADKWTRRLKAEFPLVHIAAVAEPSLGTGGMRRQQWNTLLNAQLTTSQTPLDAVILHEYPNVGMDLISGVSVADASAQATAFAAFTSNPESVSAVFASVFKRIALFKSTSLPLVPSAAHGKVWITESNVQEEDNVPVVAGSWAHALALSVLQLMFGQQAAVDVSLTHNLQSHDMAMIFRDSRYYEGRCDPSMSSCMVCTSISVCPQLATPVFGLTAEGWLLKEWQKGFMRATAAYPLSFAGVPQQTLTDTDVIPSSSIIYPSMVGTKIIGSGTTGDRAVLINLSAETHFVSTTALGFASATQTVIHSGDPKLMVTDPTTQLARIRDNNNTSGIVILPPFSLATVELAGGSAF